MKPNIRRKPRQQLADIISYYSSVYISLPAPRDRDGTTIVSGDIVEFLTKGKSPYTEDRVYKIFKNQERVISRDCAANVITRAPKNLRLKIGKDESFAY